MTTRSQNTPAYPSEASVSFGCMHVGLEIDTQV